MPEAEQGTLENRDPLRRREKNGCGLVVVGGTICVPKLTEPVRAERAEEVNPGAEEPKSGGRGWAGAGETLFWPTPAEAGGGTAGTTNTEAAGALAACMLAVRIRLEPRGKTGIGARATNSP